MLCYDYNDYLSSNWEMIEEFDYQKTKDMIMPNNLEVNEDNSEMIKRYETATEEINNSFVISDQTKNLVISLLNTELRILKGELSRDKSPWNSNIYNEIIY